MTAQPLPMPPPGRLTPSAVVALVREAVAAWIADYAPSMGAALAYYTLFSIAPLLLIVTSLAGFVFGEEASRGQIFHQLEGLMGADGAQAIQAMLESADKPAQGALAAIAGLVILLIGATTVFGELQDALDRIWRAPARHQHSGLWALLRARLLSFGMVMAIGFLLIVSLLASTALAALGRWWAPMMGELQIVAAVLNGVLSFVIITVAFALIYKIMPRVHVRWHDVWIGAVVTALLFTAGKSLIGLYIGRAGVASTFGAAASFAVVLVWVYYAAQIFLLGAEFTWVYARRYGSMRGRTGEPGRTAQPLPADEVR